MKVHNMREKDITVSGLEVIQLMKNCLLSV